MTIKVILDTNILVAAVLNRRSHSAQLLQAIEKEDLDLVWDQATLAETRRVINQIPRLSWAQLEPLYTAGSEYRGPIPSIDLAPIEDPDDRKFAALAAASGATLVSNDAHLLSVRDRLGITVLRPSELMRMRRSGD